MAFTADPGDYTAKDISFLASELARRNAESYSRTAARMRRYRNRETAELFEFLAQEERAHEKAVLERREKEPGDGNGESPPSMPRELDLAEEPLFPPYLFPHDGVCYALQHTKKVFEFFTYLSSQVTDRPTREAIDHFAKDEVSRIVVLRLERMKANRRLREYRQNLGWWRDPAGIETIEDLEARFAAMEAALAPVYGRAMEILKAAGNVEAADCLKRYAGEAFCYPIFHDVEVEKLPSGNPATEEDPVDVLLRALKVTYQALEFAFLIAETARDDEVLMAATEMAEKLSGRLKTINRYFENLAEDS